MLNAILSSNTCFYEFEIINYTVCILNNLST